MKKIFRELVLVLSMLFYMNVAQADTTAFGISLGKSTGKDVSMIYDGTTTTSGSIFGGKVYQVPVQDIEFDGLEKLTVATNDHDIVVGIFAVIDKNRSDFIISELNKKYHAKKKVLPFVGNKYVRYENKNDIITLDAPHLSFEAELSYMTKRAHQELVRNNTKKEETKKRQESSQL